MRLFLTDVDGVWTDGTILQHADGSESVAFCVHDGYGVRMLQRLGVEIAVISGRRNPAVEHRARSLGIEEVHLGHLHKERVAAELVRARRLKPKHVAAIGDDLPDLPLFEAAHFCIAPPMAVEAVRKRVHYITSARGGDGALREACELLAAARGADLELPRGAAQDPDGGAG